MVALLFELPPTLRDPNGIKLPPTQQATMMTMSRAALFILLAIFCGHTHAFLSDIRYSNFARRCWSLQAASKHAFCVAGEAMLMQDDDDALLQSAANSLIEAGNAWATDWEQVTFACADAAEALSIEGFEQIADELRDISEIGGCSSVGPPSSVPNLEQLQRHFEEMATKSGKEEFLQVASAFGDLISEYS